MSLNPLNDISAVYMKEVLEPQLGKKSSAPEAKQKNKEGGAGATSEKRIRQAVYDIRYRARREDVPLEQAFSQYMGHTSMNAVEKKEVKEKLGLGPGGGSVSEEVKDTKYQVRVKDKATGKSYVRYATREKINQLRANPNISSVEMTKYGTPYEGEKQRGEYTAKTKSGKGLDPVGREDKDIDNDGDHDKSDKYLLNRRKVRGAAIAKKTVKEGFSNWREDLREIVDDSIATEKKKEVKEKKVNNKVVINPKLAESIQNLGGQLIDVEEICEENIQEKAVSKAQQRFMGMVYAAKKGEMPASAEVAKAAKSITKKEARKFAKTKHSGLPEVKEEIDAKIQDQQTTSDDKVRMKQSDAVKKQQLQNLKMIQQKKQMLDRQRLQMQKSGKLPLNLEEIEVIDELRRSEKEGKGSPEYRTQSGQLVGARGERKRKGAMGGRHFWSGGEGGSRLERGTKKDQPYSQQSRLNPPEKKGRQLEKGSSAAMQRGHSARD